MDDPTSTTHVLSTSPPAVTLTIPHMFQHPPQQPAGSSSGPLATSPPGSNLFINHHYHPQQPAGSLTNHNHEPPPLPPINADSTNTSANTSANTSPSLTSQSLSPNFGSSPNFSLNFILSPPDNHIHNLIPPSNNSTPITNNIQIISPTSSHPTIPDSSGYLSCHTSVCLDDKIIVFGGLYKKEKRGDILVYNINDSMWDTPRVKGPIPSARYCHTTCLYKPFNSNPLSSSASSPPFPHNATLQFNSPNTNLRNPPQPTPPPPKISKPTMVVFGGLAHIRLNDVHLFDIESTTWSTIAPAGMLPLERSHHSAVLFGHHMIIFGGLADTGQRLNDVHILDLEAMCWVQPLVSGTMPPPRLAHSAEVYANRMVIFGGYDGKIRMNDVFVLDFGTMRWSQPLLQGPPPIPRFGQTMTLVGSKVVIFGGSTGVNNAHTNDHIVVLDLETLEWSEVRPTGPTPPPLHYHTAVMHANKLWYYGGVKKFNGFIVLDVDTVEILRNKGFCESRDYVHNTLTEALESLDVVFQTESMRGAPMEGIIAVTETMKSVNQNAKTVFAEMRRQLNLLTEAEMVSKEKLKQQREELEQARAIFEAHKLRMEDVNRRQLTKVKLNIGGIRYETSVATLAKDGQSMLAAMFSGLYPLQQDKDDGSIFIDRDGTHFRYILNYLRDGSFLPPRELATSHELLQEAEFYQIEGLITLLKENLQAYEAEI